MKVVDEVDPAPVPTLDASPCAVSASVMCLNQNLQWKGQDFGVIVRIIVCSL